MMLSIAVSGITPNGIAPCKYLARKTQSLRRESILYSSFAHSRITSNSFDLIEVSSPESVEVIFKSGAETSLGLNKPAI